MQIMSTAVVVKLLLFASNLSHLQTWQLHSHQLVFRACKDCIDFLSKELGLFQWDFLGI